MTDKPDAPAAPGDSQDDPDEMRQALEAGEPIDAEHIARIEAEIGATRKARGSRRATDSGGAGAAPRGTSKAVLKQFRMTDQGLVWINPDPQKSDVLVCGPFEALARTRDDNGESWGVLLTWTDGDGRAHEWAMPRSILAGDGREVRAHLLDKGLYVAPGRSAREALMTYLSAVAPEQTALCVNRGGWHDVRGAAVFVLPDAVYGQPGAERVVLQLASSLPHAFRVAGTVDQWQREIARYAVGNSRLTLAISAAFAAALLHLSGEESGGINFQGGSRLGKSTALRVAGSVWGGGGVQGYIRQWRGTANGLEGVAGQHSDALLCLDEMGQVDAKEAGEVAYLLANGAGKSRAGRDGLARVAQSWRLLFLSTGEISLADKMQEAGQRARVGQEVRLVDVPADADAGHGLFEVLHSFADGDSIARHLRDATSAYYGSPIRAFLAALVDQLAKDQDDVLLAIRVQREEFVREYVPSSASGQVLSVAGRFALIASAGALATAYGITGWEEGAAERAAARCFRAWLDRRGTSGAGEIEAGISQVMQFVAAHGASRFQAIGERGDGREEHKIINRAGFKRHDDKGRHEYLVLAKLWTHEVCKGHDARMIARELHARGLLRVDLARTGNKYAQSARIPGHGPVRVYRLASSILGDGNDADDAEDTTEGKDASQVDFRL
jgi:putative DNA primase/helicase